VFPVVKAFLCDMEWRLTVLESFLECPPSVLKEIVLAYQFLKFSRKLRKFLQKVASVILSPRRRPESLCAELVCSSVILQSNK
jgi:hypothetical protein